MKKACLVLALAALLPACGKGHSQSANAIAPQGRVQLNWTAPSGNVTGYEIEDAPAGGSFSLATTVTAPATSAVVTGLTEGVTYTFRVRAFTGGGASAYTNTVTATP